MVILVSDKVDFRAKKITETLHNDKRIKPPGTHNPEYVHINHQSVQLHEAKLDRAERRNRQSHN